MPKRCDCNLEKGARFYQTTLFFKFFFVFLFTWTFPFHWLPRYLLCCRLLFCLPAGECLSPPSPLPGPPPSPPSLSEKQQLQAIALFVLFSRFLPCLVLRLINIWRARVLLYSAVHVQFPSSRPAGAKPSSGCKQPDPLVLLFSFRYHVSTFLEMLLLWRPRSVRKRRHRRRVWLSGSTDFTFPKRRKVRHTDTTTTTTKRIPLSLFENAPIRRLLVGSLFSLSLSLSLSRFSFFFWFYFIVFCFFFWPPSGLCCWPPLVTFRPFSSERGNPPQHPPSPPWTLPSSRSRR